MYAVRQLVDELVGDREEERDERFLIRRGDGEDVEADALRRGRIVEQAVAFGLLERGGNAFGSDRLELHLTTGASE